MTLIYLVRHGETDWNLAKRIQGSTDIPLNETGRAQAATTGQLLARRSWDAIYSSPLGRARETAEIIARETGLGSPVLVDALVERQYGDAEGLDYRTVEERYPLGAPVPGREEREDVAARVLPAIMSIADEHPGESIIIVSHGGVIRTILQTVAADTDHGTIRNGSVHSFSHLDGTLELVTFDDPIELESLSCATDDIAEQNALEAH